VRPTWRPRNYALIPEDAGTFSHAYASNGGLVDSTLGPAAWTKFGAPPIGVPTALSAFGGKKSIPIGPFTTSDYYRLGTGSVADAYDVGFNAAESMITFIYEHPPVGSGVYRPLLSAGNANGTTGYYITANDNPPAAYGFPAIYTGTFYATYYAASGQHLFAGPAPAPGAVHLASVGRLRGGDINGFVVKKHDHYGAFIDYPNWLANAVGAAATDYTYLGYSAAGNTAIPAPKSQDPWNAKIYEIHGSKSSTVFPELGALDRKHRAVLGYTSLIEPDDNTVANFHVKGGELRDSTFGRASKMGASALSVAGAASLGFPNGVQAEGATGWADAAYIKYLYSGIASVVTNLCVWADYMITLVFKVNTWPSDGYKHRLWLGGVPWDQNVGITMENGGGIGLYSASHTTLGNSIGGLSAGNVYCVTFGQANGVARYSKVNGGAVVTTGGNHAVPQLTDQACIGGGNGVGESFDGLGLTIYAIRSTRSPGSAAALDALHNAIGGW
jgi:hypothetical protein